MLVHILRSRINRLVIINCLYLRTEYAEYSVVVHLEIFGIGCDSER